MRHGVERRIAGNEMMADPELSDDQKEVLRCICYWFSLEAMNSVPLSDEEVIALIKFLNEITPIKSLQLHYEEGGSLEYGEYIYSAGTLSCRELPVEHYPDATDSDSDQEHLQQAFERYGTISDIPFS